MPSGTRPVCGAAGAGVHPRQEPISPAHGDDGTHGPYDRGMTDPADRRDPDEPDENPAPTPWWQDQYDVGGLGMARLFAWAGLLLGAGALGIALFAPLEGQALRTVWIAGFGAAAMWVPWMAVPRYRRAGVPVSWAVPVAMGLGGLAILVAIYAFAVIATAASGVMLPAPDHWLGTTAPVAPGIPT